MEPKYKIGDKVWLMNSNTPTVEMVIAVVILHDKILYGTQYIPQEGKVHEGLTWAWLQNIRAKYGAPELKISNILSGIEACQLKDESFFFLTKQDLIFSL